MFIKPNPQPLSCPNTHAFGLARVAGECSFALKERGVWFFGLEGSWLVVYLVPNCPCIWLCYSRMRRCYNKIMPKKKIVTGQKLTPDVRQRARELRAAMTPAERLLWGDLRANKLAGWHFRRQQNIGRFIVDFYCHKAGLVIGS